MPIDYVPAPSAYYAQYEQSPRQAEEFEYYEQEEYSLDSDPYSQNVYEEDLEIEYPDSQLPPLDASINIPKENLKLDSQAIPSLSGTAKHDLSKEFNPKAIWGPVEARLIPETKRTLSKVISGNIGDLNRAEYQDMRDLMVYVLSTPASKQRVFELTGFEEKDIQFAEKYFRKYKRKYFFTKLVEIALATSSNGKVSKQIGGLIQFVFETDELNGAKLPDEYKYKFVRGIPELITPIWQNFAQQCAAEPINCERNYKRYMDLNDDQVIDDADIQIAMNSINWVKQRQN